MLKAEGHMEGPVMCKADGTLLSTNKVKEEFHDQLQHVQVSHPNLIDPTADVAELYSISHSLRWESLS
eukprot:12981988-Ditylum_brightwellii.AAC.1